MLFNILYIINNLINELLNYNTMERPREPKDYYMYPTNHLIGRYIEDLNKYINHLEKSVNHLLTTEDGARSADISNSVCPNCGSEEITQIAYNRCDDCYNEFDTN